MRALRYVAFTAALAVFFSLGAFANDFHSGKFDLTQSARVGKTMLQPGHYKAEWSGSKNALKVDILKHGKTVATARGHLKTLESKAPYDSVSMHPTRNHNQQVDEIDFDNHTQALVLAGA